MSQFAATRYDRTAWFYEKMAHLYSLGAIRRSKVWQMQYISEGGKVLFVGAGSGEDVVMAAQKGAQVTVVELSPKMLQGLEKRLQKQGLQDHVELILGDAFDHARLEHYDVVCANYFLNVFDQGVMLDMCRHLQTLVKADGHLLIADFAHPRGKVIAYLVQNIYFYAAVTAFRVIAKNPFHPIYDYPTLLTDPELAFDAEQGFGLVPGMFPSYRSFSFIKR